MPLNKVSKKALKKPVPEPILVTEKEIFNEVQLNKNKRIKICKIRGIAGIIKEKLTDMMTLLQNVYTVN